MQLYQLNTKFRACSTRASLRTCFFVEHSSQYLRRSSQQAVADDPTHVAVLGGGITGLSTAFYLSKLLPSTTKIELFEQGSRLGGWMNSIKVDVGGGETVVFENGPRSLRPTSTNGIVTLDLIAQIGLHHRIITTDAKSPAAQNRFIYYPDHLVRMPGPGAGLLQNVRSFFTEPAFEGIPSGILAEATKPQRPAHLADESIGSFVSRRFGSSLANKIVSAVFHGIYAGDIYQLSARTILPALWHMESRHSSIMRGLFDQAFGGLRPMPQEDVEMIKDQPRMLPYAHTLPLKIRKSSVFTFRNGLGELANRLAETLDHKSNVRVHRATAISDIELQETSTGKQVVLRSTGNNSTGKVRSNSFSHVVSTLPSTVLADCLHDSELPATLRAGVSVTVMVVNLFYTNTDVLPYHGFGYLIPRSLPLEQNPELALGVIFDTDATPGQDSTPGTKITVMIGGHWWNGWDEYPNEEEGLQKAKTVLKRHLGIADEPRAAKVSLQRDCIPQYHVGHEEQMSVIHRDLERTFKGRLRVAGNSYTGVGVNDCIRGARSIAEGLANRDGGTGLDSFAMGRPWSWVSPHDIKPT